MKVGVWTFAKRVRGLVYKIYPKHKSKNFVIKTGFYHTEIYEKSALT